MDVVEEILAPPVKSHDVRCQFVEGALEHPRTSLLYHLSLFAVSFAMIVLPLLYLTLVAAFAWGVFFYATHFYLMFHSAGFDHAGVLIFLIFYFSPIFLGLLLTFFLVKPFFAPRRETRETFSLNHADAPQLFALIGWICRSLNAPIPSRVDVDCSVNAGVEFRNGFRSLFGNDIILKIGLPLVAGMNLGQLAGVIAHEYGHFSQGTAMRANFVIRNINLWFYRVVHERDAWDIFLIQKSEGDDEAWRTRLVFLAARAGVGIGRGILWVLMATGNLLSCFMSRQMEIDADRYWLKMSGSDEVIATIPRLHQLHLGWTTASRQLAFKWTNEKKLFDQVPDFIVACADEISADAQELHYSRAFKRKTGLFDSHPSDASRIQLARVSGERGLFHDSSPATNLFTNYPELSRRLTLFFYRGLVGRGFSGQSLVPISQLHAGDDHDCTADREILERYFFGIRTDFRPFLVNENKTRNLRSFESLATEIQSMQRNMVDSLPSMKKALTNLETAQEVLSHVSQAAQLLAAGFQFDPSEFGLTNGEDDEAQRAWRHTLQRSEILLDSFEAANKTRLANALQLLPHMASALPNARTLQEEAGERTHVLARLENAFKLLAPLRANCATLELLLTYRKNQPAADNATAIIENTCAEIQESVNAIQEQSRLLRHPFQPSTGQMRVSNYLRNKKHHADPFELILREGKSHSEKLLNLHLRLLARLVEICEEVEVRLKQ